MTESVHNHSYGKDVQALETSWQAKVDAEKTAHEATKKTLTSEVERLLVTNTSQALAAEISTVPELFQDIGPSTAGGDRPVAMLHHADPCGRR